VEVRRRREARACPVLPSCEGYVREDRRLAIRLSSKNPKAIQKRAPAEGLASQTLIASLLHKDAAGRLKES
jgi:predicted DNA binding CopG/RHH family protein